MPSGVPFSVEVTAKLHELFIRHGPYVSSAVYDEMVNQTGLQRHQVVLIIYSNPAGNHVGRPRPCCHQEED